MRENRVYGVEILKERWDIIINNVWAFACTKKNLEQLFILVRFFYKFYL